jgi:predicted ATPase
VLTRLKVERFKSIRGAEFRLPSVSVLFGPNAAGKSNLIDAVQVLSRLGTGRTLSDALSDPIRGHPVETFAFPPEGLPALLRQESASFAIEADLGIEKEVYRYRVGVRIEPGSGALSVEDEYLAALNRKGEVRGNASIERIDGQIRIRRKSKPAHPRQEQVGLNHTILSDPRLGGLEYRALERCRKELSGWRTYYLDPRVSMRAAKPPAAVQDIGLLGEDVAPFLYRLRAERPKEFDSLRRTLRSLVPSVEDLSVDLDTRRGTLDILVRQGGIDFSSRIVSEGTLRVLALCAVAVNPWSGSLLAFEEPENGVHPRRLELIAQLLLSLATERGRQVLVTTHSPLFCESILRLARGREGDVALFNVRQGPEGTTPQPFDLRSPLFRDEEMKRALTSGSEDGVFEGLLLRGLLDG